MPLLLQYYYCIHSSTVASRVYVEQASSEQTYYCCTTVVLVRNKLGYTRTSTWLSIVQSTGCGATGNYPMLTSQSTTLSRRQFPRAWQLLGAMGRGAGTAQLSCTRSTYPPCRAAVVRPLFRYFLCNRQHQPLDNNVMCVARAPVFFVFARVRCDSPIPYHIPKEEHK